MMNLANLMVVTGDLSQARSLLTRLLASPASVAQLTRDERQRMENWLQKSADPEDLDREVQTPKT